MVDDNDDDVTYHAKQPADKINLDQINNAAAHSLISKERMQKLDLLIHLLSNLTQALVVCGPEGIGKTTLLEVLQQRKTESWQYCLIQGSADLSFESIHEQLTEGIANAPAQSLSMAFAQYEKQHKQVVLIVDNAGELVPGLIAAIIQYAAANPVLRVVFALTHDELQMKRGSDRAIDDCHIVEIPPLSERQCGDFLQHLSTKPYANLSFKVISENMIAHIYRDTHGIPGKIIAEISGSPVAKPSGKLKWMLVLAVAAAIAIAVVVQWLSSSANVPGIVPSLNPTSTDGGNVSKPPEAADMQPSANAPDTALPPAPVEQITGASAPGSAGIQAQGQSELAVSEAEVPAKDAIVPSVEANIPKGDHQPVTPMAKPDAASTAVAKQPENKPSAGVPQQITELPIPEKLETKAQPEPVSAVGVAQNPNSNQSVAAQQKIAEALDESQEKPKQPEITKAVNKVKPHIPKKPVMKVQPEPVSPVVVEPTLDQKQSYFVPQKIAEPLVASPEAPKPPELSKPVNPIEPFIPNKQEAISTPQATPQAPVEAAPKEPVTEAAVPAAPSPQLEPTRIVSPPIAILPPPRDGGSAANGLEPLLPPSPAQSDNNFTLQLMVLSKQSSVDDILRKYPALAPDIRVVKTIDKGKDKFTLGYGAYPDPVSANKARQSLPFEFHNALVRKVVR